MDRISRSSGWDEFSQYILLIRKFSRGFIFKKIKSSRNGEITLSTTDIGKSYPSYKIFWSPVCLLTLFARIKFSRKFPDSQYKALKRA